MADDSITRVTVYKLKIKQASELTLVDYDEVKTGNKTIDGKKYPFWLHFFQSPPVPAGWCRVFSPLNLPKNTLPHTQLAGFVLLVNIGSSFYAITGGLGHVHLRNAVDIEPRFGTHLAERILSQPELRGLVQKDTSGIVNHLDRVFRSSYNPQGELDNLRRVLTSVRGRLNKKNKHLKTIGKSIQAGNALTVNGAKSFTELFAFLAAVDKLYRSTAKQLIIPQLEYIDGKFNKDVLNRLDTALVAYLGDYKAAADFNLFLDNEDIGYLPDRVTSYEVLFGRQNSPHFDTYEDVFQHVSELLTSIAGTTARIAAYKKLRLRATFDDGHIETKPLGYFVCGDLDYNNDVYFLNNMLWYRADEKFLKQLDGELDNILCIPPEDLGLLERVFKWVFGVPGGVTSG